MAQTCGCRLQRTSAGHHAPAQVDVWDHERSEPVSSFAWGADTVTAVRFNPADSELLASAASDRAVALYDLRSATPVRKLVMQARCCAAPLAKP